jgi:hypothetical protein
MHRVIVIALALSLSGCLGSDRPGVTVKPADVHAYAGVCAVPVPDLSPAGYTFAGFDFVDEQCGIFFDGIVELSKTARFASTSIATANTQATLILTAVEAAEKSIAIVAAGSELARKLIDGYAAEYAFAPYAPEVRQLVMDAMTAYRLDTDTDRAIAALQANATTGDAYCLAHNVVRNYAKICSIANVEALARQAVANSRIGRTSPPAGTGGIGPERLAAPRAARMRRAHAEDIATFRRGLGLPNFTAGRP